MRRLAGVILLALSVTAGAAGGYWYARLPAVGLAPALAPDTTAAPAERRILYYRDPAARRIGRPNRRRTPTAATTFRSMRTRKSRSSPVERTSYCKQVHMDADQLVGMRVTHARCGDATPVAALSGEAAVAKCLRHQVGETVGDLLDAEAFLARTERHVVTRQRRCDDGERIRGIPPKLAGSVRRGIRSMNSNTDPGQPCISSSGQGFGPFPGTCRKWTLMAAAVP